MIDRATINKIMDAANIVDVVSDFVTLKRAGANLKGLCPFHDDRTPSFMVSPAKNYCKCFACGKGGNPVGFIMEHEQVSYPDALRYLAKKYGITIEEHELTPEDLQHQDDRESMFIVNEWANKWFQQQLHDTTEGRTVGLSYFRERGFRDDIIEKFQLGFCPDRNVESPSEEGRILRTGAMSHDALKAGYQEKYLINNPETGIGTGISIKNDKGCLRDRFWGRVMFPIFTISGKVVGFGGRVLNAATKGVNIKYQNSPESIIYSKKRELYGLFQAKQAIRRTNLCYLVEGYTDVMAMHQSGIENVVASSGTALTNDQIRLIHRLTDNITVIYDGDAAGIKASQRGIDLLLAQGMNVRLLLLPDGDDPDSFARKHNAEEYQEYLSQHQVDFIKFKVNLLMEEAQGDPIKKSQLVNNIVQSIACIPNEITRSIYVQETARTMQIQEQLIVSAVAQQITDNLTSERRQRERAVHNQSSQATHSSESDNLQVSNNRSAYGESLVSTTPPVEDNETEEQNSPYENLASQIQQRENERLSQKERELLRLIVRRGGEEVGMLETSNETPTRLNVLQYIATSLQQDGLSLTVPLHQRMLEAAMEGSQEEGFEVERYLLNYPDPAISNLAFELAIDRDTLSRIHQARNTSLKPSQTLSTLIIHILTDYKLEILAHEQREAMLQLQQPGDIQQQLAAMHRLRELKEIERHLSAIQGGRVMT
ncbi:MAG: DNA primase [Bacteroidaceae bacterium]|nr:DNA primase [Bacteroidaceae bacterium]